MVVGQGVGGLLTLAGNRLVTQFIGPELYGAINLAQNVLILLRTLSCSATLRAGLRYYPHAEVGGYVPALRGSLVRSLARATLPVELVVVAGGLIWSVRSGASPALALILAAFVAADVVQALETTTLNAARRQRQAAILNIAGSLAKPLFVVAGVLLIGPTLEVALAATAAGILAALATLYANKGFTETSFTAAVPAEVARDMWRYSLPLLPIAFFNWTTSVSDRYIIEWLGHDASSVGIYVAAYGLVSQPLLLIQGAIALTLRPVYFAATARNDELRAQRTLRTWLALTASMCALAAIAFAFGRVVLVNTLLGPRYRGADAFVPWISFGYILYGVEQVLEQLLLAYEHTRSVLVAQACGAIASVAITIPAVMHFGAPGAAYACPAYFLIQLIVVATLTARATMRRPASLS